MQLCATLTKDDLSSIIEQITPMRVALRPRRVITLGRPTKIELVAGTGLRVRGDARFTWDVGGLTIPVTLRSWQVLLVPSFAVQHGRHVLAFDPTLEALDFKNVPMFLDGRIAEALKDGLAAQKSKLAWAFEEKLSLVRALPAKISPHGELKLAPTGGTVTITATEMRLTLEFGFRVRRDAPPPSLRTLELEGAPSTPGLRSPRHDEHSLRSRESARGR
jgi:hypothetical protein